MLHTCHIYVWILRAHAQKERISDKRKGNPLSYPLYEKKYIISLHLSNHEPSFPIFPTLELQYYVKKVPPMYFTNTHILFSRVNNEDLLLVSMHYEIYFLK